MSGAINPQPIAPLGFQEQREPVWGFFGTGREGRMAKGDLQIFYVDSGHANANDLNEGLDPEYPLATIQELVDRSTGVSTIVAPALQTYDVVYVSGNVSEAVVIPGADVPMYVSLIGGGNGRHSPTWGSGAAGSNCLIIRREGWRVSGFTFECPASASGIRLEEVPASSISAYKTIIDNCVFDGLWSGLYGIELSGAPHRIIIANNWFVEMHQGDDSAFCIYVTDSAHTNPYQCEIIGNRFMDSDNYIGNLGSVRGFNVSLFKDNVFEEGALLTPAMMLDLRGGSLGYNIVTGNYFGRAYTNASGYWANVATPNSCWIGNVADPTPATVADNGITIAVPA